MHGWNYEYPDEDVSFDSYMIPENEVKDGQKRLLDVDNPLIHFHYHLYE